MELMKVTNRSSKVVEGIFDGQRYRWEPNETKTLPAEVAELCKRQNPIMGTEDFADITSSEYLLALPSDDHSPAEQSDKVERFDRDTIPIDPNSQQVVEMTMRRKGAANRASVAPDLKNPVGIQAQYDD